MRLNHLTEQDVQIYLDSGRTELAERVEAHIQDCDACRAAVEQYAKLYAAIELTGRKAADGSFADRVMARVAAEPLPERSVQRNLYWLLGVAGVPASLGLAVLVLYLTNTLSVTQAFVLSNLTYVNSLFSSYVDTLAGIEVSPMLVVGSGAVALLGSQIDRLRKIVNRTHTLA